MGAEGRKSVVEDNVLLGGTAIKPPGWDRTGWAAIQYLIYNPETGEVFTRTPLSWFKIFVFYCIYYSCLAGFWAAMLMVFFTTLPEGQPKWLLDNSIIGVNPGLGVRPSPTDELIDSSIFLMKSKSSDMSPTDEFGEGDKNIDYATRMKLYIDKYYKNTTGMERCATNEVRGDNDPSCIFDIQSNLGECASYPFGYTAGGSVVQPCIFVKFNKIFGWKPKPIEDLNDEQYKEMPEDLKNHIAAQSDKQQIWIDCRGRNPGDLEAATLTYFPATRGIPVKYFPYHGPNYHPPLVAIKVEVDNNRLGQLVHIECRAWFDGVFHDSKDQRGLVQFEVMLEPTA